MRGGVEASPEDEEEDGEEMKLAETKGMDSGGRKGRSSRERGERQRVWLRQEEEEEEEDEGEEEIGGPTGFVRK